MTCSPNVPNCFSDYIPNEISSQQLETLDEDAYFHPEFLCKQDDLSIFLRLREELVFQPMWLDNGMPFSRHICLGSTQIVESSPTLQEVILQLCLAFSMEPVRSMVNLYRNGGDWCNLHSDQYDAGHCGINFTIGASFGEERRLIFEEKHRDRRTGNWNEHAKKLQIPILQRNGDVHAFGQSVNDRWRHGVPRCARTQGERISVMLWGYRGKDAIVPDKGTVRLTGEFPHILALDPRIGSTPRVCEACEETKPQAGGQVDLDHRWCCSACWERDACFGSRPHAASEPSKVTDCLSMQGSQLAVAILAGRKTLECRKCDFPSGWYALHVAKRPIDEAESRRVLEQWPTAPKEHELPHEAVVGLVHMTRLSGEEPAEDCAWRRPGICYIISHVVALQRTLPACSPGNPAGPWRLSPATQQKILSLIKGMRVYENEQPKLISCTAVDAFSKLPAKESDAEHQWNSSWWNNQGWGTGWEWEASRERQWGQWGAGCQASAGTSWSWEFDRSPVAWDSASSKADTWAANRGAWLSCDTDGWKSHSWEQDIVQLTVPQKPCAAETEGVPQEGINASEEQRIHIQACDSETLYGAQLSTVSGSVSAATAQEIVNKDSSNTKLIEDITATCKIANGENLESVSEANMDQAVDTQSFGSKTLSSGEAEQDELHSVMKTPDGKHNVNSAKNAPQMSTSSRARQRYQTPRLHTKGREGEANLTVVTADAEATDGTICNGTTGGASDAPVKADPWFGSDPWSKALDSGKGIKKKLQDMGTSPWQAYRA